MQHLQELKARLEAAFAPNSAHVQFDDFNACFHISVRAPNGSVLHEERDVPVSQLMDDDVCETFISDVKAAAAGEEV